MSGLTIKKPDKTRRKFDVYIKNKGLYERVLSKKLDEINLNYQAKKNTIESSVALIKSIFGRRCDRAIELPDMDLKKVIDEKRRSDSYKFALRSLARIDLKTVDKKQLQLACDKAFNEKQSYRYVACVNKLLGFYNRGFKVQKKTRPMPIVDYVTLEQFNSIVNYVENKDLQNLYKTLFATGCRLGEAFAIKTVRNNGSVFIDSQLTIDLELRPIKNRKPHATVILPVFSGNVSEWLSCKNKSIYRKKATHPLIKASRLAIGKSISPHDLRHSFAVELLSRGVSIDRVARLIGDTVAVTERYYAGFVMSDAEISQTLSVIESHRKIPNQTNESL